MPDERQATICDMIDGWAVEGDRATHLSLQVGVPTKNFEEKAALLKAIEDTIRGFGFKVDQIPSK
jgi:hypothetical protein